MLAMIRSFNASLVVSDASVNRPSRISVASLYLRLWYLSKERTSLESESEMRGNQIHTLKDQASGRVSTHTEGRRDGSGYGEHLAAVSAASPRL